MSIRLVGVDAHIAANFISLALPCVETDLAGTNPRKRGIVPLSSVSPFKIVTTSLGHSFAFLMDFSGGQSRPPLQDVWKSNGNGFTLSVSFADSSPSGRAKGVVRCESERAKGMGQIYIISDLDTKCGWKYNESIFVKMRAVRSLFCGT